MTSTFCVFLGVRFPISEVLTSYQKPLIHYVNPLLPNTGMDILHTVLYTFPRCWQGEFGLQSFLLFSWTQCLLQEWSCKEKLDARSSSGLKSYVVSNSDGLLSVLSFLIASVGRKLFSHSAWFPEETVWFYCGKASVSFIINTSFYQINRPVPCSQIHIRQKWMPCAHTALLHFPKTWIEILGFSLK